MKIWDFIERIEHAPDALGVERCLLELASHFGFTTAFGGIVPGPYTSRSEIKSRILLQRLPHDWAQRYNERHYVFRDPIVHHLQTERSPFSWSEAYARCSSRSDVRLVRGEAREFGLREGYVVPIPTLDGSITAISFGGFHSDISEEGRDALTFAASYAIGRLLHQSSDCEFNGAKLTPREMDCLLWAAEGKSDWDISVILGISKPTVIKHLRAARDKLGAMNRAHAVLKGRASENYSLAGSCRIIMDSYPSVG